MPSQPIVYIVDDNPDSLLALMTIVDSLRLKIASFSTAEDFLASFNPDSHACLLTDLRMGGMSGLELLRHLRSSGHLIPTIIVTGYAETPIAVDAMQAGAVTFLEKTSSAHSICAAISQALRMSEQLRRKKLETERVIRIWQSFNTDERQVLQLVAEGKLNKEIAFAIGAPVRTIEDRRRRLMAKIGADSIVDLVRFAVSVEQMAQQGLLEAGRDILH